MRLTKKQVKIVKTAMVERRQRVVKTLPNSAVRAEMLREIDELLAQLTDADEIARLVS